MTSKLIRAYKEFVLRSSTKGPYKFLLQKLLSKMDIDLATSIFQSDYYRGNLKPLPLDTAIMKRVLVLAPHQDDESIGCGGLMSYLKKQNSDLHICFLTDGAPGNNDGELIARRSQEAQTVCQKLKATMHEIGISNVGMMVDIGQLKKLQSLLAENFDAVFLPWIFDGPPKHRLCNAVIGKCMKSLDWNNQEVHCYQVHTHLLPNAYFDYTHFKEQKEALLDLYPSQMEEQNYKHLSIGLDAWSSRFLGWSAEAKYVELYTRLPAVAFLELLGLYAQDVEQTFRSNSKGINAYNHLINLKLY